ncbi:MAG: M48 family metallopeptidase [Patescibacteria group bacterium]|jgi:hypothetical protein
MPTLTLLKTIPLPYLGEDVSCNVYESRRARRSWVRICSEKGIYIVVPYRARQKDQAAIDLLNTHKAWIEKHWQRALENKREHLVFPQSLVIGDIRLTGDAVAIYVKNFLVKITVELADRYNFSFDGVQVRRKKSNWGSCTRRRTISLNAKIFLLPNELRDYVICHELAHLREFNHSKRFWAELEKICPNSKIYNKQLRAFICS